MKVLRFEYGDKPITDWLITKLKQYHKKKYGEESEVVLAELEKRHIQLEQVDDKKC